MSKKRSFVDCEFFYSEKSENEEEEEEELLYSNVVKKKAKTDISCPPKISISNSSSSITLDTQRTISLLDDSDDDNNTVNTDTLEFAKNISSIKPKKPSVIKP